MKDNPNRTITVIVQQPKSKNPCGVIGLLCVIFSIPATLIFAPVGLVLGIAGFILCVVGVLFFSPKGAAGCGLVICLFPLLSLCAAPIVGIGFLEELQKQYEEENGLVDEAVELQLEEPEPPKELSPADFMAISRREYSWPTHVTLAEDRKGIHVFGGGMIDLKKGAVLKLADVFPNGRLQLLDESSGKQFTVDSKLTNFAEIYEKPE